MSLAGILELLADYPPITRIQALAGDASVQRVGVHAPTSLHALVASVIRRCGSGPTLVVTTTGQGAEDLAATIGDFLPGVAIATFPSWETLPHERLSPSADTVGRRTRTLRRITNPDADDPLLAPLDVVIASVRSLIQPIAAEIPNAAPVRLRAGDHAVLTHVVDELVGLGYDRVDLVERRGQVAVRGGIVDVFPSTEEHALRVEFWGDEVDSVRYFAVADQRSLDEAPHGLLATPVREVLLTEQVRERARDLAAHAPGIAEMCSSIAEGSAVEGMESLSALLSERMVNLVDLFPKGTQIVLSEPERVRARAIDVIRTAEEFLEAGWHNAAVGADVPIDIAPAAYRSVEEVQERAAARGDRWWELNPLSGLDPDVEFTAGVPEAYRGDAEAAISDVSAWLGAGVRVIVTARGAGPLERLAEEFSSAGLAGRIVETIDPPIDSGVALLVRSSVDQGFVLLDTGLVVLTEADLFGKRESSKDVGKMPSRRKRTIDPLSLKAGDFVVHEQHGVGRYVEMVRRTIQGAEREYLIIEYAPSKRGQPADRLFLPMDQLDMITRYG